MLKVLTAERWEMGMELEAGVGGGGAMMMTAAAAAAAMAAAKKAFTSACESDTKWGEPGSRALALISLTTGAADARVSQTIRQD